MNTKSWISTHLLSASSLPLPPFISSHLPPLASVLHEFHSSELARCVQMFFLSFFGLREAQPELQGLFVGNINTLPPRVSFAHSDSASRKLAQASLVTWISFLWQCSSLRGPPANLAVYSNFLTYYTFCFLHAIMWFACNSHSRGSQSSLVPGALRQKQPNKQA